MRLRLHLLIALLSLTLGGLGASAEPVKIRLAWVAAPPELEPVLFANPSIAKHLGHSYTLETLHFQGTSPMITGLAAGDVDIGPVAYPSFATAILNAGMTDLTIIADEFRDGIGNYLSAEYMVLADGPIKTIDDLKGKVLVTNAIGTANYIGMVAILKQHGMEERRDFTVIEAGFPSMKPMLLEGKVQLIGTSPAIAYDPELRARARVLYTQKDSMGPTQMTFFAARAGFLKKNRAAVVDFLEDELAALHWYLDPANRTEATQLLARFTKQPPERLASWVFTEKDYYRDPSGLPDLDILQKNIESQRMLGLIKGDIEVRKYADLSLVKEAAARLR